MDKHNNFHSFDYNSLLSNLKLSTDAAGQGLHDLFRAARPPVGAVGLGTVCLGASKAIDAALTFLATPTAATTQTSVRLQALLGRVGAALQSSQTAEAKAPRGRRLTKHPAWGMCLALGTRDMPLVTLIVGGLLLLQAVHDGRTVSSASAKDIMRHGEGCDLAPEALRIFLDADIDAVDTAWPWLARVQRRWPTMLNSLVEGGGPPPTPPSFNKRARGQLWACAHYAAPAHRAGTPTHRNLSKGQFDEACRRVTQWISQDDWRGAWAICSALSCLTADLLPELPLVGHTDETWVACVDVVAGTVKTDFTFLADEAAAAAANANALPASLVIEKPFPAVFAARIRQRQLRYPGARTLADLYPEALPLLGDMAMLDLRCEITPSWARWINSVGICMRVRGMDNLLASAVSNDLGHVPRSKLYYVCVGREEVWNAADAFMQKCGWGAAEPDTGTGVAFGSRVVATVDAIERVAAWHRGEVQAVRPARSDRSSDKLLAFHNHYTRCVALELALMLALREATEYQLWADIDEQIDLWVEVLDKRVPGPEGALPVPLCKRAKELIKVYRLHCQAVASKLHNLGQAGTVFHEWLLAVVRRERVALLCTASGMRRIERAGSGGAFGALPPDRRIAPDTGRKWLENELRHQRLRTGDIDAVLRHDIVGQSHSCSTSDFVLLEWALRVAPVIDRVATALLGPVRHGLSRR